MKRLVYKTAGGNSELHIGSSWEEVKNVIDVGQTVIITDDNISKHYSELFPECKLISISPGESSKSISTIEQIIKEMLELEVDRSYFLLGIGGGVVGDITGFVASVYMRGIRFGLVSTSLLSQVDASTGGKNGVNCDVYKNVIGCFTQPEFVYCDTGMLNTLDEEEFKSGVAEIVKHALIHDSQLFEFLEKVAPNLGPDKRNIMDDLVIRSVKIKIDIVEKDEKEEGERRLLNFGHTIGHAIESVSGLKHGFAVAQGMYFASLISLEEGLLSKDKFERIVSLLRSLGLISKDPEISRSYIEKVKRDKKREKTIIHFVLLEDIGRAFLKEMPLDKLIKWMENKI